MPKQKDCFLRKTLALVLSACMVILPSRAHTVAIGYVVTSPGDVTFWFGTYHAFTEMPPTEGHALLTLPDLSQLSVPFSLTSSTAPNGIASTVVFSQTHLNTATGLPYTLDEIQSWEGAPFTGLTQAGSYTIELDPAFPPTSLKWDNDVGNLTFTINPRGNAVTIPTAGLTPNEQGVLGAINRSMAGGGGTHSFTHIQMILMNAAGSAPELGQDLDQLTGIKLANFATTTAFNNDDFETAAMDMYLENLRNGIHGEFLGGNGQIDASGLTVNDPHVDPALQVVHSHMLAWNSPGSSTLSDVPRVMFGGVDMKDTKQMGNCPADSNPWNIFVRGNVVLAQGFSQADQPHFDDNTESVVLGADYRLNSHFLAGATLGYAHTDATLDTFTSSATIDSYTPGAYASYSDNGWFANFLGRYTYNSYTEARSIDFLSQTANGATDGHQGTVDLDGGYEFHSGGWTYGPTAGVQYVHLTTNGYRESGSDANLAQREDQADSLRTRLGVSVKYDFQNRSGVMFSPHLAASWQHEFLDPSRLLQSSFTNFNGGTFVTRTQENSDDFALVDTGLDAKLNRTITVFGDYLFQAGQDNYFGQSVQAGVRVNF